MMDQQRPHDRAQAEDRAWASGRHRPPRTAVSLYLLALLAVGTALLTRQTVQGQAANLTVSVELVFRAVAPGQLQGVSVAVASDGTPQAGAQVSVGITDAQGSTIGSAAGATDENGQFLAIIEVPAGTPPGRYQVVTTATVNGAGITAEPRSFGVTGPVASLEVIRLLGEGLNLRRSNRADTAGALAKFGEALSLARQIGDRVGEGQSLHRIGQTYLFADEYAPALEFLQQALAVAREAGDLGTEGDVLGNIGDVYFLRGQYTTALGFYQEALAVARQVADLPALSESSEEVNRTSVLSALNDVAAVYERLGQYPQALAINQERLTTAREGTERARAAGNSDVEELYRLDEMNALNALGNVDYARGQHARALEVHQQALAVARALGAPGSVEATLLSNIATDYDNLGLRDEALVSYQQALALVREAGLRRNEGIVLNNIAVVYREQGRYDEARAHSQQALAIARQVGDRTSEATALDNIGRADVGLGRHDDALASYQQALAIVRETGDRRAEGIILGHIGEVYEKLGDLRRALDFTQQAIAVQEDVRTLARIEELRTSLAAQSVELYQRAASLLLRLGQPGQAFDLAERGRARSFLDALGNARPEVTKGADPQLVQQEQALRLEIAALDRDIRQELAKAPAQQNRGVIESRSAELTARQAQYADLLTRLKLSDPEAASLVSVAPLTLPEVQRLLDADTTLLSYFVTPDRTLASIVRRDSFRTVELPVGEQALRGAIDEFRRFADLQDTHPQSLRQLHAWLLAPLAGELTTPVVGIIPHSVLHYLPFAALTDGQRYLGDTRTLFYLPSASTLPFIQAKRKGSADAPLALAQSQAESLPPLRFADQEAQTIAALYQAQPLLGRAATETAFKAQAGGHGILHLAAHGELNGAAPLFSRIFLEPDGQNDGSLTVQEVYSLDLAQADLVVLSACETQLGALSRGDDIVGLNRAFVYAGSPTVIASLWSVNDPATAALMTSFYSYLRQGLGKAEALQAAQIETRAQFPHPFYWAAFVLTGDPGTAP